MRHERWRRFLVALIALAIGCAVELPVGAERGGLYAEFSAAQEKSAVLLARVDCDVRVCLSAGAAKPNALGAVPWLGGTALAASARRVDWAIALPTRPARAVPTGRGTIELRI
jgi:hypothetical protein